MVHRVQEEKLHSSSKRQFKETVQRGQEGLVPMAYSKTLPWCKWKCYRNNFVKYKLKPFFLFI